MRLARWSERLPHRSRSTRQDAPHASVCPRPSCIGGYTTASRIFPGSFQAQKKHCRERETLRGGKTAFRASVVLRVRGLGGRWWTRRPIFEEGGETLCRRECDVAGGETTAFVFRLQRGTPSPGLLVGCVLRIPNVQSSSKGLTVGASLISRDDCFYTP